MGSAATSSLKQGKEEATKESTDGFGFLVSFTHKNVIVTYSTELTA